MTISCAYCQSQVEDDSFFCDQCGKEIMICIECGRTGQGKCCDEDGNELVSAKTKAGADNKTGSQRTDNLHNNPVILSNDQGNSATTTPPTNTQPVSNLITQPPFVNETINNTTSRPAPKPSGPVLRLVNANLGLTLDITSGEILGRTTGPYAQKLAAFPGISGKHLVFNYDMKNGWFLKDLGSSNGTKYNKTNKEWQNIAITNTNVPIPIENRSYILIANVEFVVQIENLSNTGTQRL
jgi:FHA domain